MRVGRGGQPPKWQKTKRKLQKSLHLLRWWRWYWNFIRAYAVLVLNYEVSCQTPWRSRTDHDFYTTKAPWWTFKRLSRSGHSKNIPMIQHLHFDPSVLRTQPSFRLARRCPPYQTVGLAMAKQAAPSSTPRVAWVLFQPVTYGIKTQVFEAKTSYKFLEF